MAPLARGGDAAGGACHLLRRRRVYAAACGHDVLADAARAQTQCGTSSRQIGFMMVPLRTRLGETSIAHMKMPPGHNRMRLTRGEKTTKNGVSLGWARKYSESCPALRCQTAVNSKVVFTVRVRPNSDAVNALPGAIMKPDAARLSSISTVLCRFSVVPPLWSLWAARARAREPGAKRSAAGYKDCGPTAIADFEDNNQSALLTVRLLYTYADSLAHESGPSRGKRRHVHSVEV